jgi:hypothetical protein
VVVVVVTVVDVVSAMVVVVSGVEVVVVVSGAVVVVVTMFAQMQPSRHVVKAPPGESGGQVSLPGGSHCSPSSRVPLPHAGGVVVVVVVTGAPSQVQTALHSVKEPSGELGGQLKLPGGSQFSPSSTTSLPQSEGVVVVVVVVLVVVVDPGPAWQASAVMRPVRISSAAKVPESSAPLLARSVPDGAQTNARTRACRRIETKDPFTRNRTSHAVMSAPGAGPTSVPLLIDTLRLTAMVTGPLASRRPRRETCKLQNTYSPGSRVSVPPLRTLTLA